MTAMDLAKQKVLVVGLGKSGLAAVRLLTARGAKVIANDVRDAAALGPAAEEARALGAELALGGHDEALFTSVDRIVLSPGVPPLAAVAAADRAGVPVASEIELASWLLEGASVIGITGTNGKSTVTTLIGEMVAATGRPTFVGGNLGTPLVDVVGTDAARAGGCVVVELSSFQLERVAHFRADVAVLLNVTDDHLDRYASFAEYAAAKGRIFHGQRREDHAVVPAGDALCTSLARAGTAALHGFDGPDAEVALEGEAIVDRQSGLRVPAGALGIRGRHNVSNACAAALAARLAGVSPQTIEQVLRSFRGLPHRMVHVRDLDGVAYLDDSKATNVGAAAAAIDGLSGIAGRVVLLAGGKDKGGSYTPLRERLATRGRAAVLIGEAAPLIREALAGLDLPVEVARDMDDAVRRGRALARPGDAVLLAPACASFDMFRSYAHRGDEFQRAVKELR
jgi:UDP-N-acetylmuramoylalanine--D-glutamate ligase